MTASSELKQVVIYTDGGCLGNPGQGGYGVVLLYGRHRKELSAGYRYTTNNRMELMAAIAALEALKLPCRVTLYTDSEYLRRGALSAEQWRRDGWRLNPPKAKQASNRDLWKRFLAARKSHEVEVEWVKGHANVAENERCDQLAGLAADGRELQVDEEYERYNAWTPPPENACRPPPGAAGQKITHAGQPCRKCGRPVERRQPKRRRTTGQFYYEYYFACPGCRTMYLVEEAKRTFD